MLLLRVYHERNRWLRRQNGTLVGAALKSTINDMWQAKHDSLWDRLNNVLQGLWIRKQKFLKVLKAHVNVIKNGNTMQESNQEFISRQEKSLPQIMKQA